MKKGVYLTSLLLIVLAITGCETTGMSMREKGSFNYSNFVYGLYDKSKTINSAKTEITTPIKLAVAQVGESVPPRSLIDELRREHRLFSKVVTLPAGGPEQPQYYQQQKSVDETAEFEERMVKMRMLAKDMNADYIFLFGGSADFGSRASWLQIFDLSIIGGFIIPSTQITADGRASGALIDVATGQVMFMVNSEASQQEWVPTVNAYSEPDQLGVRLRDELVESLSKEFIEKVSEIQG